MVSTVLLVLLELLTFTGIIGSIARIGKPRKASTPLDSAVEVTVSIIVGFLYYLMWRG